MIICVIFIIQAFILVYIGWKRGFLRNSISFVANIVNIVVAFFVARLVVGSMAEKTGSDIVVTIGDKYAADLNNFLAVQEFSTFAMSVVIGIVVFYLVYFLMLILNIIFKHVIFYDKAEKIFHKRENSMGEKASLSKIGTMLISLLSVTLTFVVLFTPIGFVYNTIGASLEIKDLNGLPFVSETFFDKLTEMPNNENDIKPSEEVKYTLTTGVAFYELKNGSDSKEMVKENFSKSYFLPTVISEVGATAAKQWKNGDEFFGMEAEIPEGREGELYLKALGILEKWNKQVVVEDVGTLLDIYELMDNYGIDKLKEENGLVEALATEEFAEELFVSLYQNSDFANLVPAVVEYGLGTAFDSMGINLNEEYVSNVDVSKLSEEDIRREARIVSGMIRTILEIQETNQKMGNGEMSLQDIQRIIEEISNLKDSQVLGDIANEFVLQLRNSIPNLQF